MSMMSQLFINREEEEEYVSQIEIPRTTNEYRDLLFGTRTTRQRNEPVRRTQKFIIELISDSQNNEETECPICMDNHKKKECIMTSCKHMFGKQCFYQWMDKQPQRETTCPLCRKYCSEMIIYA
jgi:hypothetical protein